MILLAVAGQVKNVLLLYLFTISVIALDFSSGRPPSFEACFKCASGLRFLYTLCLTNDHIVLRSQALCQVHIHDIF